MSRFLKGEIYFADLNPTVGSEIAKTRPVLIGSNDINNQYSSTVTIVPVTSSTEKIYPTVDKLRLQRQLGKINEEKLKEIERAISIHLEIEL